MTLDSDETSLQNRTELLLSLLENDWYSYEELGDLTDKPERTLRRDFQRLQRQGYQIESKRSGKHKVFRLKPGSRKKPIEPGILEVIAANLGRGLLGFLQGTELRDQMEGLFQKLRQSSRASERQLRELDRKFWFMPDAPRDYQGCDEQLNEIITCLIDRKKAVILYATRQRKTEEIRIQPYTLIVRRECLYVLAGVEDSHGAFVGMPRLFDLTRISSCRRLRETFELPVEWDPSEVFRESFGVFIPREGEAPAKQVRIWFEAGVGLMIQRRRWHWSQQWRISREGGWLVDLEVRVCPELVHWIMGFGPKARVISPPELRDAVRKELVDAVAVYESVSDPEG